jgi:hypothetical protein
MQESWQRPENEAIQILDDTISSKTSSEVPAVPLFVILFLSKRKSFTSQSLQRFLLLACTILRRGASTSAFTDRQVFLLFTRLHRHAKDMWTPGMVPIASIVTTFIPTCLPPSAQPWPDETRFRITSMYNRALLLLSQATKYRPYHAYWFIEQAQFVVLTKMAQFDTPLDLTPLGYKGLIKVQLAAKHTDQERDWINLQSRALPPFPEPKNAFDEQKGYEYAQSRAMKTIEHMKAVGYSVPQWESVAKHYAGWETDGTPTIQSRSILPNHDQVEKQPQAALWSSRINAGRDIRESWAAFLRFEASGHPTNPWIYFAMFKKIVSEYERVADTNPYANVVVGNVRELLPPAASPLQKIYLESEPPTYMTFFHKMMDAGVVPQQSFFGYLIGHAPSIQDGLSIWYRIAGPDTDLVKSALLDPSVQPMSPAVFCGLIQLLTRFPLGHGIINHLGDELRAKLHTVATNMVPDTQRFSFMRNFHETSIFQVYCLLLWRNYPDIKPWSDLMNGISWSCTHGDMWPESYNYIDFVNGIVKGMQENGVLIEPAFFTRACQYFEVAGRNSRSLSAWTPEGEAAELRVILAKTTLRTGCQTLRSLFASMTTGQIPHSHVEITAKQVGIAAVPGIFFIFTSYDCLRYARALAAFGDHQGVLELTQWIVRNEQWLAPVFCNEEGGRRRWRSILAMFRLALTAPSALHDHVTEGQLPRASSEMVQDVVQELGKLQTLDTWPRFGDIMEYFRVLDKEWLGEKVNDKSDLGIFARIAPEQDEDIPEVLGYSGEPEEQMRSVGRMD